MSTEDKLLLDAYYDGWYGRIPESALPLSNARIAYEIGKTHYILGDDNSYWDSLTDEGILKIIKNAL